MVLPGPLQDFHPAQGHPLKHAESEARAQGHLVVLIDGRAVPDKAALLSQLATALKFPAYFGGNLDALHDCLGDLEQYAPAPGYLVLFEHGDAACPASREDFTAVVEVMEEAAREWRAQPDAKPFRVVVSA